MEHYDVLNALGCQAGYQTIELIKIQSEAAIGHPGSRLQQVDSKAKTTGLYAKRQGGEELCSPMFG